MTTIRVICAKCGSKLDIRAELAGSTRRCPKCKTEFQVPLPVEETPEDEEGVIVVDSEEPSASAEPSSTLESDPKRSLRNDDSSLISSSGSEGDEDDEDEDYLPSFVTETAKEKAAAQPKPQKSHPKVVDEEDDGPVLSIPKIPPPSRPKSQSFDPDAFLNDEPQPTRPMDTPPPLPRDRSPRTRFGNDFDDDDSGVRPRKARETGPRDLHIPPPEKTGLSDPGVRAEGGTRDRAQAARELRQALKDSALKGPQEPEKAGGLAVDLSIFFSEIGIKGLGVIAGVILFLPVLYYVSYHMLVGGEELPPLGYVSGKVTLDGAPIPGATVFFAPLEPEGGEKVLKKGVPRTSSGVTDDAGNYKMMYKEGIQGVSVGKCRVWVALPPPQFALEYSQGAQNMKEVAAGTNPNVDFPLTSPPRRK